MKQMNFYPFKAGKIAILLLGLFFSNSLLAQQVSSLTYPTPNVVIANVSNVYLAPNLVGNPLSYSITPGLPTGISFNTSTGVISGVATVASPATIYTVTATGASNSTTGTLSLQVTSNFFNNTYGDLTFAGPIVNGSTGNLIGGTTSATTYGRNAGDKVIYKNIVTIGGTSLDCIVTTVAATVDSWAAYDQEVPSSQTYSNNDPKFFSPQVTFPNNNSGELIFDFQFILGGTYNVGSQKGLNVVLQNVKVNTYDIDGNGAANSNQATEFGGFSSYQLGNPTNIAAPTVSGGLTTFKAISNTNFTNVLDPETRVLVKYNDMSNFRIRLTGQGTAYFFLDFGSGATFATVQPEVKSPVIDLNTTVIGVNNANAGCGQQLSFTPSGQSNVTAPGTLTKFTVSFPTIDIKNAADEELWVNGTTTPATALKIALNGTTVGNFTLGGINYAGTGSTAANVTTYTFTRVTAGAFTQANAEALLDALTYNNKSMIATPGERHFTVNVYDQQFKSPDAIYTALLNCVSIAGSIYHDINGMVDGIVNATGASQFGANALYAVLVNPSTNQVIDSKGIAAGGAYNFGTVSPGSYAIFVTTPAMVPAIGATFTTANFPAGYVPTGENLGSGPGNDALTNGRLLVTVGSAPITGANFGLQIPPTSSDNTINNINNPGGFNNYTPPSGSFIVNDADGSVTNIVINSFPTNTNYLKVGTVYYTNGGTCPPQVGSCTPWPGTLSVPFTGNNPSSAVSVDPIDGATSVVIDYNAYDDAQMTTSTSSKLTINFVAATTQVSGNVWNDANGNGIKDNAETLINTAAPGQNLYAVLVQNNNTISGVPTVFTSVAIDASTGYTFTNIPNGNDYTVKIISLASAPVVGQAASLYSPALAPDWTGVSTNANGTIVTGLNTNAPQISISNLAANQSNLNFGIEQIPGSDDVTVTIPRRIPSVVTFTLDNTNYPLGNTSVQFPPLSGNDPEDGALGGGKTVVITSIPNNATLIYSGGTVIAGQTIPNYNPSLLQVQLSVPGSMIITFNYAFVDAAGIQDPTPATYTINTRFPLTVQLTKFSALAENGDAKLDWVTSNENNNAGFGIEHSLNSVDWNQIGFVNSKAVNGNSNQELNYQYFDRNISNGAHYYRLKQMDLDGKYSYSNVEKVEMNSSAASIKLYPNPANSYLYIEYNGADKTPVRIMDFNGRLVKSLYTTGNKTRVETGELSSGTYVALIDGNSIKFTIQK